MRRVALALGVCVFAMTVLVPAARADSSGADLAVTIAWVGKGIPRVHPGDTATWTVTVRNNGPETAQQVSASFGGSDQFASFTADCGQCDLGSLASGASASFRFSGRLCAFGIGEVRGAFAYAGASSVTPDPNPDNNFSGDLVTRIIGPRSGTTCPPATIVDAQTTIRPGTGHMVCPAVPSFCEPSRGNDAVVRINARTRFSSIDRVCLTFHFSADLLDPGEGFRFSLDGSGFGFDLDPSSPVSLSSRVLCLIASLHPAIASFLDGHETIDVWMYHGWGVPSTVSATLTGLDVQILGSPATGSR